MLCKFWAMTTILFLHGKWNFNGFHEKRLLTKAALIDLLNLSIMCWSLSKSKA